MDLPAERLVSKTFKKLKYFNFIGRKKNQYTETLDIAAVSGH